MEGEGVGEERVGFLLEGFLGAEGVGDIGLLVQGDVEGVGSLFLDAEDRVPVEWVPNQRDFLTVRKVLLGIVDVLLDPPVNWLFALGVPLVLGGLLHAGFPEAAEHVAVLELFFDGIIGLERVAFERVGLLRVAECRFFF